jgi:hypothetical protein
VSRATTHALSVSRPSEPRRARATRGHETHPTAGQADSGPCCLGLLGAMARPQQAERALCTQAELGFGPEVV